MIHNKNTIEENGFDLLLHESFENLSREEEKKYEALSQAMEGISTPKLKQTMKKKKRQKALKKALAYSATAATILLVLFGTHLFLYANVEAYRHQFQKVFVLYNTGEGGFGSLNTIGSEEEGAFFNIATPAEGFPYAFWIPEGYTLETIEDVTVYHGYCLYTNEEGESISIIYTLHENNMLGIETGTSGFFDTEDSVIEELNINGNEGIGILRKYLGRIMYSIIWADENYTLDIYGDFNENAAGYQEMMQKMAKSLMYAN